MVFVIESPRAGRRVAVRCLALAAVALLGIRGPGGVSAGVGGVIVDMGAVEEQP